jgi:V8-like Glu-specific endopeptidase
MRDFANPVLNESDREGPGAGTPELDPYASIRSAMSVEHAGLPANEVTLILGRMPATLVLHQLLHSPEMRRAALASLLGKAARRSVRFNGSDVSIAAYLRMVSRLCREVAEQTEASGKAAGSGGFELEEENQLAEESCTGIIGSDNRVPVNQAWDIPYRWVCQISARRRKGGALQKFGPAGTGILISPRFVLTAAHILRSSKKDERGQWVDSEAEYVVVTPARNEDAGANKAPFGQFEARRWQLCPKYNPRSADAWKHDYAVIELKEPAGAKRAPVLSNALLCFWGSRECGGNTNLEVLDAAQLAGRTAYTAGYPADRGDGTRLFSASGMLSNVDIPGRLEIMNYDADGCPGQSGSPIWIERDGKRYLAGIFTEVGTVSDAATGRVSGNNAVRLTRGVLDQISRWLEAVMETPWLDNREASAESSTGEAEMVAYDTPVIVERDTPKTSVRQVSVGQRVELDVGQGASGADLEQVRWSIPGRAVRGYEANASEAKLSELTPADLERPKISFFWVDAANDRAVRAKIRRKSGAVEEFVAVFDVEGPKMAAFTGKPGVTRIVKEHGTVGMQFGKPFEAPGIEWKWKITMPAHHGGFVKDVQTVLTDRSKIQSLAPGGTKTRPLVWRHPSNPKPHVQLDGDSDNQAIYTPGLVEERRDAGT